ncbi:MAG: recombination-associated protein RdgC [Rubrivivax sp.]|nr:recombination-associated protein RdgC [Rubrivivax sp.]MCZ2088075.1 recombination-associated protein RdgC [Burkholderiales bacterium]TXI20837.1 MAG: recombination-associated protein RdgC [Ottowia sp.]HOZ95210.1 recombination-associated protein RdgC [Ottowia sp.]HQQ53321.1 recombination-associated protein RdgC [Ottowia sp.]
MFKNLMLYRLGPGWPASAAQLEEALAREPFAECGATQQKSTGWVAPRGEQHGALVEAVDGQWIARFAIETKPVPGDAVRRKVQQAVAEIEKTSGRKPGKKELRDLRDDALLALLPQAFARRSQVTLWLNPQQRWLALDAGSQGKADEVIASLVRVAGQGFAIHLLQTAHSPQAAMTGWLAATSADDWPEGLHVERECELKGSGDEPAVVKFTRHELATDEVRQHIAEGKLPTRLALGWQGRVGFVLTQALQLKKIGFLDGVFDERPAPASADERFDADVALATGELRGLITDLIAALGGEIEPGTPSGFTEAPTPASTVTEEATVAADDPPF